MSEIELLQVNVEQFLRSDAALQYVTVTGIRPRTALSAAQIQTMINEALKGVTKRNGKAGISIIVMMPEVREAEGNLPGVQGMLSLQIRVVENILINMGAEGTGQSCEEVALYVAGVLQHRGFDGVSSLRLDANPVVPMVEGLPRGFVEYAVVMKSGFGQAAVALVATPVVEAEAGSLTITCATGGAAIYYTLDGSYPGPGNAAAVLYAGAVTLEVGSYNLRTAGHKAGLAASLERQVGFEVEEG
jgi:hypothetical protein